MCAVCLVDIGVTDGVVDIHVDSDGFGICPMSGREPFMWDEVSTRQAVGNRSGGRCEYCGAIAMDMHHRLARSQGGLWSPGNILHLCRADHDDFTFHRRELGYKLGILVHRNQIPADVPVETPGGLRWLSDDVAPPLPGWAR